MSDPVLRAVRAAVGPDPGSATDAELLRRFADRRDADAFELLVHRHAGMVQAVCRAVLRDRHHAEDAAQAAFLLLARRAAGVRGNPAGWLYRTARRLALRMRQRQRRAGGVNPLRDFPGRDTVSHPGSPAGGLHPPLAPDELSTLHAELAALPDRYRLPVLLCHLEGLSHADAAARLGWPVGTVAGRLSRARDRLRDRLTHRGLAPAGLAAVAADAGFAAATARRAVGFVAGGAADIPPAVLSLTHGAMRAMTIAKLKLVASVVLAAVAVAAGLPAAAPGPADPPARTADAAQRATSVKALKTLIVAWYHHEGATGWLPADSTSPTGQPLLSWRVHLLPSLGQDALYKRFQLTEPWDSPANKPLLAEMPAAFRSAFQPAAATDTHFQGFAGVGTAFQPGRKLRAADILDGSSNTVVLAEAGPAVPWTKPADLPYDYRKPFPRVEWPFADVRHVAAGDGAVRTLRPDVPEPRWRKLVEIADGDRTDPGFDGLTLPAR